MAPEARQSSMARTRAAARRCSRASWCVPAPPCIKTLWTLSARSIRSGHHTFACSSSLLFVLFFSYTVQKCNLVLAGDQDVVDLEDHLDHLRRQEQLLPLGDERVENVLVAHVCLAGRPPSRGRGRLCAGSAHLGKRSARPPTCHGPALPLVPLNKASTPRRGFCSVTWRALMPVSVSMGAKPEFSARVNGTASRASANARMAYCSMLDTWRSPHHRALACKPHQRKEGGNRERHGDTGRAMSLRRGA